MILRDIYEKRIDRYINPAVVVSDQKQETIDSEIDEYVFTHELIEKLYIFLDVFLNKKQGKTGIWVNGYYGSGKSHFLKYIGYCLNPKTSEKAFTHFIDSVEKAKMGLSDVEATPSNILNLKKKIQTACPAEIIFNVENVTGDGEKGERLTRVFLRMFNEFRGYNSSNITLAILLEKHLDQAGVFEKFKTKIEKDLGILWGRDAARLAATQLNKIIEIAAELDPKLDKESIYGVLSKSETFEISIKDTLIPELNLYLNDKPKDFRFIFLVDEVSQYIGKNREILLNLQTIVEEISNRCNNQIWVACTAQQSLEELTEGFAESDVKDEFGKILGRFDTRISLESTDAAYITQKRILDKNSKGLLALEKVYTKNKEAIEMQFNLKHDLYKGFVSDSEFFRAYPFVPYQFRLISSVFASFQDIGYVIREVKDNERSVLGITHFTAKKNADKEVGYFIPFDAFFNDQFSSNMQQRGRSAIKPAMDLCLLKKDEFAVRVVKVLFMISNLAENVRRTFPSNIDNISLLLMDQIDINKLQLQEKVKKVLLKLAEENVIREEDNCYFFYNEDELEVSRLVTGTQVNTDDRDNTFNDIAGSLIEISKKIRYRDNDFQITYKVDEKIFFKGQDIDVTILLNDPENVDQKAMHNNRNSLLVCFNEPFMANETLKKDFLKICKTNKYLKLNSDTAGNVRSKTLDSFRDRNRAAILKIQSEFKTIYKSVRYISGQTVIDASEIRGDQSKERFKNVLEKHLSLLFNKLGLAESYSKTQADLKEKIKQKYFQATIDSSMTPAEEIVNSYITSQGESINVQDLINQFSKPPYGWRIEALIEILIELNRKKHRVFEYRNTTRYPIDDFAEKCFSTAERSSCIVRKAEGMDPQLFENGTKAFKDIFNIAPPSSTDHDLVFLKLKEEIGKLISSYETPYKKMEGKYTFATALSNWTDKLSKLKDMRDPASFYKTLADEKESYKTDSDYAKKMADFAERMLVEYQKIKTFAEANKENFSLLESEEERENGVLLLEYLTQNDPVSEFRHMKKRYEELKSGLSNLVETLRKEVIEIYSGIFDILEMRIVDEKLENHKIAFISRDFFIETLEGDNSLNSLRLKLTQADDFRTLQIKAIIDFSNEIKKGKGEQVKEARNYYIKKGKKSELRTEKDVKEYIEKVEEEMMEMINQKKIIIIK